MSLIESDPCQGDCIDCTMCDATKEVLVKDLQFIADNSVDDDIRAMAWKYLNAVT